MNELIIKNPITSTIKQAVNNSQNTLHFAVPFLNSFALAILDKDIVKNIKDKRLIIRFDSSCLITFDIPVLEKLLEMGFKIRYDNDIHLKLYITDSEIFVTSSNLTKSGFEKNQELTVKVDSENTQDCKAVFEEIWHNTQNKIDKKLLTDSYPKYYLLKKREDFAKRNKNSDLRATISGQRVYSQDIIEYVFKMDDDYSYLRDLTYRANQKRELLKGRLKKGFDKELFYIPAGHPLRHQNLFYDLSYGTESEIAGTGLWERHFREVFKHPEFPKVVEYLYPEMIGMKPWNLADEDELYEFCCGIFDFKIPQFTETLPIRLASYFYPEYFIPIFKLSDLGSICTCLDLQTKAQSKADRFYAYTIHIRNQMQHLPYGSNVKFNIAYIVLHTFQLRNRLESGENYDDVIAGCAKDWEKRYFGKARQVLQEMGKNNKLNDK